MRFLADESCDFAVVRELRAGGHDVLAVSEFEQRSVDEELMELARSTDRILLTEDKDFGWLAFVGLRQSPGVVLIRFPASARSKLATAVQRLVSEHGQKLDKAFTVIRPGSIRISLRSMNREKPTK